jgi:hypothetical protein
MFFRRHREADPGDGVTYREAFTTDTAQAEVTHLVNERGLERDRGAAIEAERRSALYLSPAECHSALPPPEPGKIVFVYRKTPAATATAGSEHATFRKLAA